MFLSDIVYLIWWIFLDESKLEGLIISWSLCSLLISDFINSNTALSSYLMVIVRVVLVFVLTRAPSAAINPTI